ncbi:MAG TPA: NAD(P)H-hydrate epimerase [bacterium]|nr:NAD(P)H-hydrate epimerase [bacterium]HOM25989.1 NAD(P)H-hydrate epimerase [bacterium]
MKKIILTREEILKIEKETVEKFGISNLILMENAGRESFYVIKKILKDIKNRKFFILCGKGNNGGDGFVLTRYLFNNGANVKVFYLGKPEDFTDISFLNFEILRRLKIDTESINDLKLKGLKIERKDVFIDAILGIGIKGEIKGDMRNVIEFINKSSIYTVSIDIPSGLDADTGEIHGVSVKSNITISMGFLKKGFFTGKGPEYVGKIKLVDIGFPKYYYEKDK